MSIGICQPVTIDHPITYHWCSVGTSVGTDFVLIHFSEIISILGEEILAQVMETIHKNVSEVPCLPGQEKLLATITSFIASWHLKQLSNPFLKELMAI